MRKKKILMLLRLILVSVAVFAASLLLSNFTRMILSRETNLFLRDEGQTSLVVGMIEGAVGAIAAAFVLFELQTNRNVQLHESDIEESQFLFEYNQAFIQDEHMVKVESQLERWMEGRTEHNGTLITDENRQLFVNYLVYLEGLAPLVFRGIMRLEHIDDLMAYRFYLATNNPELQEDQLYRYPEYYRGCFQLYRIWTEYRNKNGLPILLAEHALDRWDQFPLYSYGVQVRPCLETDDLSRVAGLIYDTDPYIYPAAFSNRRNAVRSIRRMMKQDGVFRLSNYRVAVREGVICGAALLLPDRRSAEVPEELSASGRASCRDVAEKYFSKLGHYPEDGKLYVACICVNKEMRGQKIGEILLRSVINEFPGSTIVLDVLSDNEAAVRLYRKCGFTVTEEGDGYSYRGDRPHCLTMSRSPRREETAGTDSRTESARNA